MRIAIVGAGALGLLFAIHLHQCGENVYLINRKGENAETIKRDGIQVKWPNGKEQRFYIPIYTQIGSLPAADTVLLLVKGYATSNAIRMVLPIISEETIIITLQNGMGNIEKMTSILGESAHISAGTTICASTRLSANHIYINHIGETYIGYLQREPDERLKVITKTLSRCGIPTKCETRIKQKLWEKLFSNIAINPITALLDVPNGHIVKNGNCKELVKKLINEAVKVAEADGMTFSKDKVIESVFSIASKTGNNISSMLQDIRNGKKTEIDNINGWIVAKGRFYSIPTPTNEAITLLIKAKGG